MNFHFSIVVFSGLPSVIQPVSVPNVANIKLTIGDGSSDHSSTNSVVPSSIRLNANVTSAIDDQQKEICSYDTIDALPHVDHYRNLFSITSPEAKTRPTLEALHETAAGSAKLRLGSTIDLNGEIINPLVSHHEQTAQVDVKPKVEIVKFGWIIGVLV
jgi:hypothetical protein